MTEWQTEFARKLKTVRKTASDHFERVADQTITPTYEEFRKFTAQQELESTAPLSKRGVRTFRFALSENAYVLLAFHLDGVQHCKFLGEFCVPNLGKLPPASERLVLGDEPQVRRVFEHALDRFLDALVEALGGHEEGPGDFVWSERESHCKNTHQQLQESTLRR